MSTITHGRRSAPPRERTRPAGRASAAQRPYFVINGATMVSIAAIAITVIGLLYLIQTSQVAQLGYDMSRLQTQRDNLALEISELEYELARYESLQTVERVATERLGMSEMSTYEFLTAQEPAERELPLPEPEALESPTFFERILDAVRGVGSANSETAQPEPVNSQSSDEVAP